MAWNFVIQLIIAIALAALSYILMPKPKGNTLRPSDSVKVTGTRIGAELPVIFGSPFIEDPNVVWFGDLKITERRVSA